MNKGVNEVIRMCEDFKKIKMDYIYLAKCGEYHKIGISQVPISRVKALNSGTPIPSELVATYATVNPRPIEQILHKAFDDKRVHNEWFKLDEKDLHFIERTLSPENGFYVSVMDAHKEIVEVADYVEDSMKNFINSHKKLGQALEMVVKASRDEDKESVELLCSSLLKKSFSTLNRNYSPKDIYKLFFEIGKYAYKDNYEGVITNFYTRD